MSTSTSCRLCDVRAADLERAGRRPNGVLECRPVVEVTAGEGVGRLQPLDGPLEADRAAAGARPGAEVDDVVGDHDRLRFVLDDEHGVALVPQLEEQGVHPLDVVRVQADGRLVEDVGHVCQRGPDVADHLGALRLSPGQRARGAIEREVAQADLDERVEEVQQVGDQGRRALVVDAAQPLGRIGDLQGAHVGDAVPVDLRRARRLVEPAPVTGRTGLEDRCPLDERSDMRLQRVDVLAEHRLADLRDQPVIGDVDATCLDLRRLPVQEVVALLLGVVLDRLLRVEESGLGVLDHHPAVGGVARHQDGPLGERLRLVDDHGQVEVGDGAAPLTLGTHPAEVDGVLDDLLLALGAGHDPARPRGRDVEGERRRPADVGLAEAAEQAAQHRVGVGDRAERRARVRPEALLVDQDGGGQPLENVDLGPGHVRHEDLDERRVRLVDQPARLRGDRVEHQRALARARYAGEHGQPALRDLDADVLEVVDPRALHADQVVSVGDVQLRRARVGPRGQAHVSILCGTGAQRSWISPRTLPSGSVNVATRRPPPTSCAASCRVAPAAVTSASFASMSATCQ